MACPNLNFFHVVYIKGHWARLRRHFIGLLAWGLLVWPCKISKPWDFCFAPLERCGIWQKYYLNTCQILKRNDKSNYQFCGLISSGGITIKSLIRYWIVWTFFPLTPTHNHAIKSVAHIPQSTSPTSHNVPFYSRNVHMCAYFCYKMIYFGIFVQCAVEFVSWVYSLHKKAFSQQHVIGTTNNTSKSVGRKWKHIWWY